ncbi:pirin family protein [Corynebacterium tapiri]
MTVRRTLPQKQRSLIGAWCFIDHYGPDNVSKSGGMDVAPHPHTGLQTVSWLFSGNVMHHDSGDHHAVVVPGEVNLMTAGAGICHSEVSTQSTTVLHGVQLWTALPDSARHGQRRFDHFRPPRTLLDGGHALVFIGELAGARSPIPTFTPLVGAEITVEPHSEVVLGLNPDFEHGVLVDSGDITVGSTHVEVSALAYTGVGETSISIANASDHPARLILIGGEPFREQIVMWWNFLGRSHEEIEQFRQQWEHHDERFGHTRGYISHDREGVDRLPAPPLPNTRLRPRVNPAPVART